MDKYKDPYEIYYNPYSVYPDNKNKNNESYGFGNYGYKNNGYNQNSYNQNGYNQNSYNQNRYNQGKYKRNGYDQYKLDPNRMIDKNMQVPIQIPEEDYNGIDEMDKKKMKALYPEICRRIQYYIEEECDKMDHSGSYMYDEHPEKEIIEMVTDKIYEKVEKDNSIDIKEFEDNTQLNEIDDEVEVSGKRCGYYKKPNKWLRYNIQIMFLNEMFGRRRKKARGRHRRKPLYYCAQPYYYRYPDFFE